MIKILTGYSEKGGSTTALINLTNKFNEIDIPCTLYGPHSWHLNKCKADLIQNAYLNENDIVISHFLKLKKRPNVKKVVLSCHEKWWFDVGGIYQYWDEVVFLHQQHKDYHFKYKGKYELIPNLKENLIPKDKPELDKIAGVIGSIENRKQTHVSIDRALEDGCEKVYVIGHVGDHNYYDTYIKDRLKNNKVSLVPYQTDKQKMYDKLGRVYHSSNGEVACLVKDECYLTNTKFFGNEETENEVSMLSNDEIISSWKKLLGI
jgi:hypothetical protein